MKDKFYFVVSGDEEDLKDFVTMLREEEMRYSLPEIGMTVTESPTTLRKKGTRKSELFRVQKYQAVSVLGEALISGIVIEITKETVRAILNWLKERRKKRKKPRLVIRVEGDILKLNAKELKLLTTILEKASEKRS